MGIHRFFPWFKETMSDCLIRMGQGETFQDLIDDGDIVPIDNFFIDLNGVFHQAAQQVYKYGNNKPQKRLLGRQCQERGNLRTQVFKTVCETIENLFQIVNPTQRLILCVDGPAPQSKQKQQRQRRFKSAMESANIEDPYNLPKFDSNCLTPGTKFMDHLTKYIDWYIRKRVSEDKKWQSIQVIFSNEKVPGEGEHKCNRAGTPILMYDGGVKKVEDIKVGDIVIGDDGTRRTVLSTVSGEDEMYEIIQNNADNYTVNKNHILSLRIAEHKRIYWAKKESAWIVGWYNYENNRYQRKQFSGSKEEGLKSAQEYLATIPDNNVLDISVKDYLNLPKNTQNKLYGFRCSKVHWKRQDVKIEPYLLGLWLGDGCKEDTSITTNDLEIVDFLHEYCSENNFRLHQGNRTEKCRGDMHYRITDDTQQHNRLMHELKQYNLIQNKHIPRQYIVNNQETRLSLLAGLIDSDGNVTKNGRLVRISQCLNHKQLVDDIVYLSRSLGFCVNVRTEKCVHRYKDEKKIGECYQITISGDLHLIPTKILRKKCSPPPIPGENGHSIVVDKLRTSIKVKPVGWDKYYGFNTDGNHRFLLGDFTVTHNCLNFIRQHNKPSESYCIHGLDSDLIMLALGTKLPKMYLLREDQFDYDNEFFCIDIGDVQRRLQDMMHWGEGKKFTPEYAINDFIFLCFLIGNDFLPQMPSIEVWNRGLDMIISVYKDVCSQHGHITQVLNGQVLFVKTSLEVFLGTIAQFEKVMLEEKIDSRVPYIPDELLEQCTEVIEEGENEGKSRVDIDLYRGLYYTYKFSDNETTIPNICHSYLEGMQWVLWYYTEGVPNWKWFYPYHYAPFAHDLSKYVKTFKFPKYDKTVPNLPYQQLLCVLPPKSADLIPYPLSNLLTKQNSPIRHFYPEKFQIDTSGKRKEYEGVVILPIVNSELIQKVYNEYINKVDKNDLKRNMHGKSFTYVYDPTKETVFESYYGDIPRCAVNISTIDI